MSRVLYISYDGITDPLGQSQVLSYVIELSRNGYNFVLLSCEKLDAYKNNRGLIEKLLEGTNVKWVPIFYTKKPPILSTLYDYWKLKRKAISLHKANKFQIVHCRSYIPSMIGLWMKKKCKVKFIFDMRGFWADERVDVGLWDLKNKIYKGVYSFFKMKEKAFLENADHIVSLTLAGKKEMDSWKHIEKLSLPISIIPCCADTALFDRRKIKLEAMQNARQELGIRADEPILTYIGSITWYLIDEMFRFFIIYLEKYPEGKFLFITHASADFIRSRAKAAGVSMDKILIVSAQRSSVPALAILGHFSIIFRKPAYSTKAACPTKQGELMSLGIPIICNSNVGDMDMIVRQYGSGIIVDSSNDSDYRKTVDNMKKIMFDPDKIREGAIDYFSLQLAVSKYKSIYSSLLN
ncbi:MAG: glycosyltransferase [Nitrospina sp.]|jgi:glycosyltransferase involved in cell wall biosynthesis|nr:glycosyltransferase [Nitrospina sp.]MBT5631366.1 glycosyltransferase [Nitrospina sp.]